VSESAVSAKRGWGSFGAKPAQSETPVRAAAKRRPPAQRRSGRKSRSYLEVLARPKLKYSQGLWQQLSQLIKKNC